MGRPRLGQQTKSCRKGKAGRSALTSTFAPLFPDTGKHSGRDQEEIKDSWLKETLSITSNDKGDRKVGLLLGSSPVSLFLEDGEQPGELWGHRAGWLCVRLWPAWLCGQDWGAGL